MKKMNKIKNLDRDYRGFCDPKGITPMESLWENPYYHIVDSLIKKVLIKF